MADVQIINESPVTLQEVKNHLEEMKKRDKDLGFRATKTLEFVDAFLAKKKDVLAKKKTLLDLNIGRLRDRHVVKILDVMPEDLDSLKAILSGENVTLKQEDLKKVLEVLQQ
ncbi:MAG: hypothetical protein Q7R96_04695 [Nanoarchaeota archaeon]|nr:hypothetical protein [Nanoarchaeota archaeon]